MRWLSVLLVPCLMLFVVGCGKSDETTDASSGGGGGGGGAPCTGKIIYAKSVTSGNFGGASGADTLCNASKPAGHSSSSFKALVADVGARAACYSSGNDVCTSSTTGRQDWPLAASTIYCAVNGDTIGTTSANALMSATGYVDSANAYKYFSGFNSTWGISNSNNCTDFSTTGGAASTAGTTNSGFGPGTTLACASAGYVLCVEQ